VVEVLIVEDDAEAKDALSACLERYGREKDTAFSITWIASALEFLEKRPNADIIFMDIEMPGITGMEAAEELRSYDMDTPLVFVTNLAQYAVHGYAVDAVDFIVKPVDYGSFSLRMSRVMCKMAHSEKHSIVLGGGSARQAIETREIAYVDVDGHYLGYHLTGGEVIRVRGSMVQAERELASSPFVRISSSELVNMAQVRRLERDSVTLEGGEVLWFSRSRRKTASERIVRFLAGGRV